MIASHDSYLLPKMAAISDLLLHPMSESIHTIPIVWLDPKNVGLAFGITLLSRIEAEILRQFTSTSGTWRQSSIYDSHRHRTLLTSVPLCSSTTKIRGWSWDSRCFLVYKLRLTFSYLLPVYGRHLNFRFEHSHQLYIVEVKFGCPTVQ